MKIIRFEINQAGEVPPAADGGNLADPSRRKAFQRRIIFRQKNIRSLPQTAAVAHGGGFFVGGGQPAGFRAVDVQRLCIGCATGVQRVCIENRAYNALWGRFLGRTEIGCATGVQLMCSGCVFTEFATYI